MRLRPGWVRTRVLDASTFGWPTRRTLHRGGETLISSGGVLPTGWAPEGWTAQVVGNPWPAGGDGYWVVQWYTDDPTKYIRPSNSVGEFGFSFAPTTNVTLGDNYTIWFGGANYGTDSFARRLCKPCISTSSPTGLGVSLLPDTSSGFEASLSLTAEAAVPEPTTIIVWSVLGLVATGLGLWRRKRAG